MDCQPQFRPMLKIFLTNALTLSLLLQMKALGSQDVTIFNILFQFIQIYCRCLLDPTPLSAE